MFGRQAKVAVAGAVKAAPGFGYGCGAGCAVFLPGTDQGVGKVRVFAEFRHKPDTFR